MEVLMTRFVAQSFAILAFTLPAAASADALRDELRVCRDLTDDEVRLICYDAAVDRSKKGAYSTPAPASGNTPAAPPAEAAGASGTAAASGAAAASISQEALFGKTTDEVERTVEEATGDERIDRLTATVTKLQQYAYNKVLITLDNDQVWKQIDTSSLRLRAGDAVEIERASLGSFMLRKQGSKRSMRVSRED
jgi:hypothetical protein